MCTVTIVPRGHEAFRMTCNRDERRARPAALAPRRRRQGRLFAAFPLDRPGGGTWIGVNSVGVAIALLNRNRREGQVSAAPAPVTRGAIIPALLSLGGLPQVLRLAQRLDASRFEPFRLVAVQADRVAVITSDGLNLRFDDSGYSLPLLFTSSSLGEANVEAWRRDLFEEIVVGDPAGWLHGQMRFHRHQWPDRPEISVLMERTDTATVSRTIVDVTTTRTRLRYHALPVTTADAEGPCDDATR